MPVIDHAPDVCRKRTKYGRKTILAELAEETTIRNFRIVQTKDSRQIERSIKHYNLQIIVAVGFKVNNDRTVQFRKRANRIVNRFREPEDEICKKLGVIEYEILPWQTPGLCERKQK